MWGTHRLKGPYQLSRRFIPMHVGEHSEMSFSKALHVGLSPRLWGTHRIHRHRRNCHRFIPTHVRNTAPLFCVNILLLFHPHTCGEHLCCGAGGFSEGGSSPLMWGTCRRSGWQGSNRRFIPTHVGNTLSLTREVNLSTVHPHACGEHIFLFLFLGVDYGSSPRMRGTRHF